MEDRVRAFNNLPRSETTPAGTYVPTENGRNHWIFGICCFDMGMDSIASIGDIILAYNPETGQFNQGGPANMLSFPTIDEKADAILPCLLDMFIKPSVPMLQPFAPWSWAALDPELAPLLEERLKRAGVLPDLCHVGVCNAPDREFLIECREKLHQRMLQFSASEVEREPVALGDSSRCHGCRCRAECFFHPLRKCAGCGLTFYHSRECQKKHWKIHKGTCGKSSSTGTSSSTSESIIVPHEYYRTEAPKDPAARSLMSSLYLEGDPKSHRIALIIHRLVFTGQDTQSNLRLLFGPDYTQDPQIKAHHERIRIELLLDAPPGSPWYRYNTRKGMFDSRLVRAVRPIQTPSERRQIEEIRAIQEVIQRGVDGGKSPSESLDDLPASLQRFHTAPGRGLSEISRIMSLAEKTMDQGLDVVVEEERDPLDGLDNPDVD